MKMPTLSTPTASQLATINSTALPHPPKHILRLKSGDVMQQMREVEIDHEGRIYRLRVTQLNKLILTA